MPRHSSMETEGSLKTNKAPEKAGQIGTRGIGKEVALKERYHLSK